MQSSPNSNFSRLLAILGVVALLVGFVVLLLLPALRLAAWGVALLGILLLVIAFIIGRRQVGRALTGRRGRFSAGTAVMSLIFIGIIIFVNFINIGNYKRFDTTGLSQFTLTSQTKDVLRELKTPVEVLFFYGVSGQLDVLLRSYADSLLNEYKNYTDKLTIRFIDTDAQPEQAREYSVVAYSLGGESVYSTAVFKSENRPLKVYFYEMVAFDDQGQITAIEVEHAFTSAILRVTGTVQEKVYFLTGHGEASINSNESGGYSSVRASLRDNLFQVETLSLVVAPSIPEDSAALIIAGLQEPLTGDEVDVIKRYIDDGGWVLLLLNPNSPQNIRELLTPWGVNIEDGTVIDTSFYEAQYGKDYPLVPRTRPDVFLADVYFPGATAIIPQEKPPENLDIKPLLWTSKDSWLDKDFDPKKDPIFTDGVDIKGPLALGALITSKLPASTASTEEQAAFKDTRIIVFGDSDFASNLHFFSGNNGDLFLKAVNLLTTGKELISIERKVLPFRRLLVTQEQTNIITYSSIALLPLLVLLAGGVIWWRRR